ncbi:unnamed protein product, partial [marine sediment metagenome]
YCSNKYGHVKKFNWMDCAQCGVMYNELTDVEMDRDTVVGVPMGHRVESFNNDNDDHQTSNCFCCRFEENDDDYSTDEVNWIGSQEINRQQGCMSPITYIYKPRPCLYYTSVFFLIISAISTVAILGTWIGRLIAVSSISQCTPYIDTKIGFSGCVSNQDGSYVGGHTCSGCAGFGFLIFAIPLLAIELICVIIFMFVKRCRRINREADGCSIFWKYLLMPIYYVILAMVIIGLLYLYAVPFTNVVGQALFADFKCPDDSGIWQICGRSRQDGYGSDSTFHFDHNGDNAVVGFLVFLIIQSTIGLFILAIIMFICSRMKGYVKKYKFDDILRDSLVKGDNWIKVTYNQDYVCCGYLSKCRAYGPSFYYGSVSCFIFSIVIFTVVIGVYCGRAIAVTN